MSGVDEVGGFGGAPIDRFLDGVKDGKMSKNEQVQEDEEKTNSDWSWIFPFSSHDEILEFVANS